MINSASTAVLANKAGCLVVMLLFATVTFSCKQKTSEPIDLDPIRIDQSEIALTDSTGTKSDDESGSFSKKLRIDTIMEGVYHLSFSFSSDGRRTAHNLEIPIRFFPDRPGDWDEVRQTFHWVPNLKQNAEQIISQHAFRSPAIILTHQQGAVSIIPDVKAMKTWSGTPYYMDLNFGDDGIVVWYGLSNYNARDHVYYEHKDSSFVLPEKIDLGLYIISSSSSSPLEILQRTNRFLWDTVAQTYRNSILPQVVPFGKYADVGYGMALNKYWVKGPKPHMGGITLSTFLDTITGVYRGREFKDDVWFHSWFNSARTAYGLYLWGKETDNKLWMEKALATMNLLLSSPRPEGFFSTIWFPEKNDWVASGQGGGHDLYHVPDNAWTAIWLLRFNNELKKIPGTDDFLIDFTRGLLKTQLSNGSFPARVRVSDLSADPALANSASGSLPTWFLEEMILRKKLPADLDTVARIAVKRSLSFLGKEILPQQLFQDFEVFFSCAPNSLNHFDSLTWLHPHNTLSIQWSAEAFLKAYKLFDDEEDLKRAEYCLNLLSLYQQVWNPPFIDLYAFGGFGVQNTDAEWSDARQAQFAETYLNFFLVTGKREYLERGVAACRASFALMAIPENKVISPRNYEGTAYNGEFIGAMAENFGHSGYNERSYQSGFHWGTGSALTTAAIFQSTLGDIYVDGQSRRAIGINGIVVDQTHWKDTLHLMTRRVTGSTNLKVRGSGPALGKPVRIDNDPLVLRIE